MKAAVMGYGTIGSGVAEILEVNKDVIAKRCGEPLELKYVLDLRDFEGDPIADKIVHDYMTIVEDPEVAIVVETMGGVEPAYTFVKAMLEAGKHVTTSNKALVAAKGAELIALAKEKNGGKPIKVVANLPYYITTPIIMGLFESHVPLASITIMVQKEVADRMQVGPGTKEYGALSLAVQYFAKPEVVCVVPPTCFVPQPKVASSVIRLTCHEKPPVEITDEGFLFRVIRASFNQRRKTLANGLNNAPTIPVSKENIIATIEELGYPASVRGETLSLEEFARLSEALKKKVH